MLACIEQHRKMEGLYGLLGRADAVMQLKTDMEQVCLHTELHRAMEGGK